MAKKKKDQDDWSVNIGGNVSIEKGDFIGRDKNVSVGAGGINVEGDVEINQQAAMQKELFERILKQIEQRPNTPPEDADDLKTNVQEFKAEADKGEQADESFLARRLRNIERIAPDIGDVLMATITNPAAGFAMIVKKVAERASKSQSGQPPGGTQIDGDANVDGGDFVARDKVVQNIQNVNFDIEKLVAALKQSLPEGDPAPQYLLDALKSFQHYHASLHEWKELHNFLNDVLFMFAPFTLEIDRVEIANEQPNPRLLGQLWRPISQKVNALLEWGKSIQHIGAPFVQSEQGLQGTSWAIDMCIAKEHLDQLLKSAKVEAGDLFDARGEFGEKAETNMYLDDKKLRETADELYSLSRVVLGSLSHE